MKVLPILFLSSLLNFTFFAQITVFETDFQSGIPMSMSIIDNDSNIPNTGVSEYNEAWICVSDPVNSTDSVAAATSWFETADTADRWIITPALTLGTFGNVINWNAKSQDASFPDDYYILASTTDMNLTSFTDTLGFIQQENFEWTERTIDLSDEGYDNQTIYIAFVLRTFDGYKLYLDDISVIKEDNSGVSELEEYNVQMYPNPCHDFINIQSEFPIHRIFIYDMTGQKVIESTEANISIIHLDKGTYRLVAHSNYGVFSKSLIKL